MLQCFVCTPRLILRKKMLEKCSIAQSFIRTEMTTYRIGTLAAFNLQFDFLKVVQSCFGKWSMVVDDWFFHKDYLPNLQIRSIIQTRSSFPSTTGPTELFKSWLRYPYMVTIHNIPPDCNRAAYRWLGRIPTVPLRSDGPEFKTPA